MYKSKGSHERIFAKARAAGTGVRAGKFATIRKAESVSVR